MINYERVIEQFKHAYKHMGSNAKHTIEHDIKFWEDAGMIDFVTANVFRAINNAMYTNHGKLY